MPGVEVFFFFDFPMNEVSWASNYVNEIRLDVFQIKFLGQSTPTCDDVLVISAETSKLEFAGGIWNDVTRVLWGWLINARRDCANTDLTRVDKKILRRHSRFHYQQPVSNLRSLKVLLNSKRVKDEMRQRPRMSHDSQLKETLTNH